MNSASKDPVSSCRAALVARINGPIGWDDECDRIGVRLAAALMEQGASERQAVEALRSIGLSRKGSRQLVREASTTAVQAEGTPRSGLQHADDSRASPESSTTDQDTKSPSESESKGCASLFEQAIYLLGCLIFVGAASVVGEVLGLGFASAFGRTERLSPAGALGMFIGALIIAALLVLAVLPLPKYLERAGGRPMNDRRFVISSSVLAALTLLDICSIPFLDIDYGAGAFVRLILVGYCLYMIGGWRRHARREYFVVASALLCAQCLNVVSTPELSVIAP